MASTDYAAVSQLQGNWPHTLLSFQKLTRAMASLYGARGKKTWFGRDRGLAAYTLFEEKLRDTLLAMVLDGMLERDAEAEAFRSSLVAFGAAFQQAYPNWQNAYAFAEEYFIDSAGQATARIQDLLKSV